MQKLKTLQGKWDIKDKETKYYICKFFLLIYATNIKDQETTWEDSKFGLERWLWGRVPAVQAQRSEFKSLEPTLKVGPDPGGSSEHL